MEEIVRGRDCVLDFVSLRRSERELRKNPKRITEQCFRGFFQRLHFRRRLGRVVVFKEERVGRGEAVLDFATDHFQDLDRVLR